MWVQNALQGQPCTGHADHKGSTIPVAISHVSACPHTRSLPTTVQQARAQLDVVLPIYITCLSTISPMDAVQDTDVVGAGRPNVAGDQLQLVLPRSGLVRVGPSNSSGPVRSPDRSRLSGPLWTASKFGNTACLSIPSVCINYSMLKCTLLRWHVVVNTPSGHPGSSWVVDG